MATKKRTRPAPRRKRLSDLVRYVCARCSQEPSLLGATKLNKALWYIDTTSFRLWDYTISGETAYMKLQHGPVPKQILPTLKKLEKSGYLIVQWATHFGYKKREFRSAEKPDDPHFMKVFNDQERDLIDGIVESITRDHTAVSISELSHDAIWEVAELGEDIPVFAVLAAFDAEVTSADKRLCKDAVDEWIAASKKSA